MQGYIHHVYVNLSEDLFLYKLEADKKTAKINKVSCACDFQQSGILTSVDSDEPVQPPFRLRNSK